MDHGRTWISVQLIRPKSDRIPFVPAFAKHNDVGVFELAKSKLLEGMAKEVWVAFRPRNRDEPKTSF